MFNIFFINLIKKAIRFITLPIGVLSFFYVIAFGFASYYDEASKNPNTDYSPYLIQYGIILVLIIVAINLIRHLLRDKDYDEE